MADDDDKILRRYRELPREEPPRHLDDAILAAARRAVHTRPAPLVVPTGRQRWYFPLAAAAIIVLAVAVTMHMEREQPAEEVMSSATAPAAAAPAVVPSAREMMRNETAAQPERPKAERKRKTESTDSRELRDQRSDAAPPSELQKAPQPAPPPAAPAQDAVGNIAQPASGRISEQTEAPMAASAAKPAPAPEAKRRFEEGARAASSLSAFARQSPEQWLQGIADLRKQGRHEEADKELAEFRKRHPDYQIPPAMRERVERR
ncbi:MAG TPA: hypothetical protein VL982_05335 [Burkholderiales bacterium]|jgi:hypothetical protein|nr:hypothetical protein [Burkholderiales bacterium]